MCTDFHKKTHSLNSVHISFKLFFCKRTKIYKQNICTFFVKNLKSINSVHISFSFTIKFFPRLNTTNLALAGIGDCSAEQRRTIKCIQQQITSTNTTEFFSKIEYDEFSPRGNRRLQCRAAPKN